MDDKIGGYAFVAGVALAIIGGVAGSMVAMYAGIISLVLVLLGLVVGFLNVSDKETNSFLIAAVALLAVGSVNGLVKIDQIIMPLGTMLQAVVSQLGVFVAPAALIVALKSAMGLAKN